MVLTGYDSDGKIPFTQGLQRLVYAREGADETVVDFVLPFSVDLANGGAVRFPEQIDQGWPQGLAEGPDIGCPGSPMPQDRLCRVIVAVENDRDVSARVPSKSNRMP